ncbi:MULTISPECIES: salt stress protein, Slr1339 family [Nostocales]|uniref:Uncharacterized protein n=2 Tax=Nostocales TaxID=1161 RepID=A0A0C1N7Z8_9CYAN|nr:hypothetical protein [Tolypothrix bouteillei]KAF3886756.1 hypothetical protein DA73_0400015650 [Tolypothrix bouteillei VB521301]
MDSIDKLLAELKANYEQPKPEQSQQVPTNAIANYEQPKPEQSQQVPTNAIAIPLSKATNPIDNLLEQVKAEFEQKDLALEWERQEQIQQEQIQLLEIEAKKIETLKKQAQDWLDKLDPYSPEGLWFERFSEGYPSKIEAAIEYLQNNS